MENLKKMQEGKYTILMQVLFGLSSPTPIPSQLDDLDEEFNQVDFVDPSLNDSQKDAIKFALASKEVALIHGPPGVHLSVICP